MAFMQVNSVRLFYEETGNGEALVMAHGSWGDHHNWDLVVPALAERYRVITYDRRGHSQSERPATQGSFDEDADDLAALIKALGIAPALVIGNSGGSIIALKAAVRHSAAIRALVVHEPPLIGLLAGKPEFEAPLATAKGPMDQVAELLSCQEWERAAQLFANTIAIGPGAWEDVMSPELRTTFVHNAPTFWDELHDSTGLWLDLDKLARFQRSILLTTGTASAPFFGPVAEIVAAAVPTVTHQVLDGANHVPHIVEPERFVSTVTGFLDGVGAFV